MSKSGDEEGKGRRTKALAVACVTFALAIVPLAILVRAVTASDVAPPPRSRLVPRPERALGPDEVAALGRIRTCFGGSASDDACEHVAPVEASCIDAVERLASQRGSPALRNEDGNRLLLALIPAYRTLGCASAGDERARVARVAVLEWLLRRESAGVVRWAAQAIATDAHALGLDARWIARLDQAQAAVVTRERERTLDTCAQSAAGRKRLDYEAMSEVVHRHFAALTRPRATRGSPEAHPVPSRLRCMTMSYDRCRTLRSHALAAMTADAFLDHERYAWLERALDAARARLSSIDGAPSTPSPR